MRGSQEDTAARLMAAVQGELVAACTRYDGAGEFRRVAWDRDGLGGARHGCWRDGRVFERAGIDPDLWWFGGGCDLTPSYGFDEDAVHFHRTLADWCDRHDPAWYPAWKTACDEYFTIPHRGENRGIGGVFFDHLTGDFDRCYKLVVDGLGTILPAYLPILDRRCDMPYGERERAWQLLRRGRYVEFNLVHDRGTLFGLQTLSVLG